MDRIELTAKVFEELVLGIELSKTLKEEILNQYGTRLMTERIAKALCKENIGLGVENYKMGWKLLSNTQDRELFFYKHYKCLDADDVTICFQELESPFNALVRGAYRHKEYLPDNPDNRELVVWLKSIQYITSFEIKRVGEDECDAERNVISCWVKAK